MNTHVLPLRINDHALQRWIERGSTYGDENKSDLHMAVMRATPVPKDEPTPFPRVRTDFLFKCVTNPRTYFIVEDHSARGFYLLRTVINPENWHPEWRPGFEKPVEEPPPVLPWRLTVMLAAECTNPKTIRKTVTRLGQYRRAHQGDARVVRLIDAKLHALRQILPPAPPGPGVVETIQKAADAHYRRMNTPVAEFVTAAQVQHAMKKLNKKLALTAADHIHRPEIEARLGELLARLCELKPARHRNESTPCINDEVV